MDVGLDSGAFSVDTGKVKDLTIEQYADYLQRQGHRYSMAFTFDVLHDGPASYRNWLWLRKQGLDTVPVYHIGTDEKYLRRYLRQTDTIAIGAIANLHTKHRLKGLSYIWREYLLDDNGRPTHKAHGLGLTSARIMFGYPWNSVDSASALLSGSYGGVFLPLRLRRTESGELEEDPTAHHWGKVTISMRQGKNTKLGNKAMFFQWPKEVQDQYHEYLAQSDVIVGQPPAADIELKSGLFPTEDSPPPDGDTPEDQSKGIVLSTHWSGRVAWNMMFMNRWSNRVKGPTIYFVSNPHVVAALVRWGLTDLALLISFARKEAELNRFWRKTNGST